MPIEPPAAYEAYLLGLPRYGTQGVGAYKPGLDRMVSLAEAMGNPHRRLRSVHVAGTNGKGSTASLLAAIATAAGLRTGLHTSPHLFRLNERLRIDGVPVPDAWLAETVNRYRPAFDALQPSFFEATTALSFLYFAEAGVDLAVIEVGLGGRLDATNILTPVLAIITHIGLDHTALLGSTPAAIAAEKAGIIKPGVPVLTAVDQPAAMAVIADVAADRSAPLHRLQQEVTPANLAAGPAHVVLDLTTPCRTYAGLHIGLPGRHQVNNAGLAVRAAEMRVPPVAAAADAVYTGCRAVRQLSGLRGRLEVIQTSPRVVVDVGHNPEGLQVALDYMRAHTDGQLHVLFGVLNDKDVGRMGALLQAAGATVFAVRIDGQRAVPVDHLIRQLRAAGAHVAGAGTVDEGRAWFQRTAAPRDALLVTGSHQVAAQVPLP